MSVLGGGGFSLLVFAATVASTGVVACGGGGGGAGAVAVPTGIAAAALTQLWRRLGQDTKLARHKCWFALRRAEKAATEHADWASEAEQLKIIAHVDAELAAVEAYVVKKLGTPSADGPLITGSGDRTPAHLDLEDVAKIRWDAKPADIKKVASEYRELRRTRAASIIWRAAAIEPAVWKPAPAIELDEAVLDYLLDRRLRVVERMEMNVNAGIGMRTWRVADDGRWLDGTRVRMFEYGVIPKREFEGVIARFPDFQPNGDQYVQWTPHVRASLQKQLVLDNTSKTTYWIFYKAGDKKPHEVIETLFKPNVDFLQRAWWYCDAVVSACLVEALWFALRRKTGDDTAFDGIFKPLYVYFGPHVDSSRSGVLMDDEPNDHHFENDRRPEPLLQVGDELVVWNHRLYDYMGKGAYRNEYSLVMDIDSDPQAGLDRTTGLFLAGHGLSTAKAPAIAAELAALFASQLDSARAAIAAAGTAATTLTIDHGEGKKVTVVRWDPYGECTTAPWWVKIDKAIWGGPDGYGFASKQAALDGFARTIEGESADQPGYTPPPGDADTIYFPLFEPIFPDGGYGGDTWRSYLTSRRAGTRGAMKLRPLTVDGRIAPGLFYRTKDIPVVRPQAT